MTDTHPTLTDLQRARIDYARRDLDYTRSEDLPHIDAAGLILLVEKLRFRLSDMLDLVDEVCRPTEEDH
ncbi:hypothetical protein [Streptomyces sp. NPDC059597]|uniref:hypothetical protein n=1 Tax=Streptomyces sp. NPDC059597 TaxID=3346879 RepID=UPI003674F2E6